MKLKIFSFTVILFVLGILMPEQVYALEKIETIIPESERNEGYGAMISPFSVEYVLDWGSTMSDEMILQNPTTNKIKYTLSVIDFGIDEDGEVVTYESETGPYSIKSMISLETEEVELEPGEGIIIGYEVMAPLESEAGDHYGYIKVSSDKETTYDDSGSQVGTGVMILPAVVLSVRVTIGEAEYGGNFLGMSVEKEYYHNPPVIFDLIYENKGNVAYDPEGHISIIDFLGRKVAEIPVGDWRVYRDSIRSHAFGWGAKWGIGPYKAVAAVSRAGTDEFDMFEVSFWVFPWKWALGVVLALVIIALTLKQFGRKKID